MKFIFLSTSGNIEKKTSIFNEKRVDLIRLVQETEYIKWKVSKLKI